MVKKLQKMSADSKKKSAFSVDGNAPLAQAVKDSAQQIWLAGLGAFAKAQEEGGKMFESLVKDGLSIQRKTQSAAEDKISEASNKMVSMASGIQSKAGHQWDKLETIFEERVSKALAKLGVPTQRDMDAVKDALNARMDAMSLTPAQRAAATRRANTAARKAGTAAPAKKAATRSASASAGNRTSTSANTTSSAPAKKTRRSPQRKATNAAAVNPAAPTASASGATAAPAAKKAAASRRPAAKRSTPAVKAAAKAAPPAAKTAESSTPSAS